MQAIKKTEQNTATPDSGEASRSILSSVSTEHRPGWAVYSGIFLTSAAVLLLELALTRVFAVVLWAHLAFMVVGTALFGFGLSGVYLALRPQATATNPRLSFSRMALLMAASIIGCYLVITHVPFRMWNFHEDAVNYLYLATWYVALLVPFFLAGLIVARILSTYREHCSRLYGVDLLGAAVGSLMLIPIIPAAGAEGTVVTAALLAALASLCYTPRRNFTQRGLAVVCLAILALLLPKADEVFPIKLHQTKRRFNTAVEHNHIYDTRWSTLSRVDVAYHRKDVFDVWIDGGTNESAILKWDGDEESLTPLRWSTIGTAYDLKRGTSPEVLIIGPAGGKEVLFALSHGAKHVDAVEMDPSIVKVVNEPKYAQFMGHLYQNKRVSLYNDEGRSFLRRQPGEHYDIIQFVNNYTPVAMNAGALNLSAAFLLTKEAFNDYLDHLTPNGVLALHRGATLRVAIMALEVLAERGVANPRNHILISAGEVPYFDGFFLKKSPWTDEEVSKVREYLRDRPLQNGKTLLWNPLGGNKGIYAEVLESDPTQLKKYYTSLGVKLYPPRDDKPFIEHFLQFGKSELSDKLPREFHHREGQKWRSIIPRGDFPYLAILGESALLSLVFIAFPLVLFARSSFKHQHFGGFLTYFSALGFGFIVVEICLMKRYVLFLGNPAYSITTVLVALLCGAGLGSITSGRLGQNNPGKALKTVVPLLAGLLVLETLVSPLVFDRFLAVGFSGRIAIASALLFPLGFIMGMPFPLGLELINRTTPDDLERRRIIAWAWGMNGYFTVIGSAGTVFIALFAGFKAALIAAIAVYLLGLFAMRGVTRTAS